MTDFTVGCITGGSIGAIVVYVIMFIQLKRAIQALRDYSEPTNKYKESSEELIRELKKRLGMKYN